MWCRVSKTSVVRLKCQKHSLSIVNVIYFSQVQTWCLSMHKHVFEVKFSQYWITSVYCTIFEGGWLNILVILISKKTKSLQGTENCARKNPTYRRHWTSLSVWIIEQNIQKIIILRCVMCHLSNVTIAISHSHWPSPSMHSRMLL